MSEMNVYQKLAKARVELLKQPLKKSGHNNNAGYEYFTLDDFLPTVTKIFYQLDLCSIFRIEEPRRTKSGDDVTETPSIAYLEIINSEDPTQMIIFSSQIASAGMKGIQDIGAIHTYMRRYLWLSAMEITELDEVDATAGKEDEEEAKNSPEKDPAAYKPRKATQAQINKIKSLFIGKVQRYEQMMEAYKIHELKELTAAQASAIISRMEGEKTA